MAKRTVEISLDDRGQSLRFKITEMTATRLESWILRALSLVTSQGDKLGEMRDLHEAARFLSRQGLNGLISADFNLAKPLLDELLGCCQRLTAGVAMQCDPGNIDDYVQDAATLFNLRNEALRLNLAFGDADAQSANQSK